MPTVSWAQLTKSEAPDDPSLVAASPFPDSKKVTIYCRVDRESFLAAGLRSPVSISRPSGDFLLHNFA